MDREAEFRRSLERCPWCGGRVSVILANEPGELTLVSCSGTDFGDLACKWSMTGQDADKAIASVNLKQTA